ARCDVVLDMNYQPAGNDGTPDGVTARLNGPNLELLVGSQVVYSGPLSQVSSLTILGSTDSEWIDLYSGFGGIPVTVDAGDGDDSVGVLIAHTDTGAIAGNFTLSGGVGNDRLNLFGVNMTLDDTYLVGSGVVLARVATTAVYRHDQFENVSVRGGSGHTNISVYSSAADTLTLDGGGGDDTITVGAGDNVHPSPGTLFVNGGTDRDTLTVNDQANPYSDTFVVASNYVQRQYAATVRFGTVEAVAVHAGGGNSILNISPPAAGVAVTVDAGPGDDRFWMTGNDPGLTQLTLDGGAGTDTLDYTSYSLPL